MKPILQAAFLACAVASALPATAAVSLESGSLAVAFYQVIGGVVQNNTYTFDLGAASLYRENTAVNVSVSTINPGLSSGNIGADLTAAFGANWANDGSVRWMVVGNVGQTDPTIGGDPARTSYLSRGITSVSGSGTSAVPTVTSTNRGILSNNIEPFLDGITAATQTAGVNAAGVIVDKSAINSVEEFLPPATLTYFGIGINPTQILGAGVLGGDAAGALDLYRILHTTAGADLSAGLSGTDATLGDGQYIGTLVLSNDGNLSMIPEPSSLLLSAAGLALCFRRRRP